MAIAIVIGSGIVFTLVGMYLMGKATMERGFELGGIAPEPQTAERLAGIAPGLTFDAGALEAI